MRIYQVWFLGSIPGKIFTFPVAIPSAGKLVLKALHSFVSFADGDTAIHFGGLSYMDDGYEGATGEWVEWKDDEGRDIWLHPFESGE
jgi:hypothetical protein